MLRVALHLMTVVCRSDAVLSWLRGHVMLRILVVFGFVIALIVFYVGSRAVLSKGMVLMIVEVLVMGDGRQVMDGVNLILGSRWLLDNLLILLHVMTTSVRMFSAIIVHEVLFLVAIAIDIEEDVLMDYVLMSMAMRTMIILISLGLNIDMLALRGLLLGKPLLVAFKIIIAVTAVQLRVRLTLVVVVGRLSLVRASRTETNNLGLMAFMRLHNSVNNFLEVWFVTMMGQFSELESSIVVNRLLMVYRGLGHFSLFLN